MNDLLPVFFCFGFFLLLIPTVLAIVALSSIRDLSRQVVQLKEQLRLITRSLAIAPPTPAQPPPQPAAIPVAPTIAPAAITTEAPSQPPIITATPVRPTPLSPPAPSKPAKPPISIEQHLIRLAVGVGGVAFALAGIFLVKAAFEHNYLTPPVRIILGLIFGAALLAVGIWRHHKENLIAQALSAAGIADLFACFLAATNLYHFLTPTVGFLLLAATTALAVVLSLRQGPFIAILGLVGGFITPALIHTDHPNILSLFGYLFLLHVGLIAVTRARQWAWLATLTVLCSFAWIGVWLLTQPWTSDDGAVLGIFLLLSTAAVAFSAATAEIAWHDNPLWARALTCLTFLLGLCLSGALLAASQFSTTEWLFIGLLSIGCFVLARLRAFYEPFAWLAAAFVFVLLSAWTNPFVLDPIFNLDPLQARLTIAAFGVFFPLAAYACLWGSRIPRRWAILSIASALAYTLLAYFNLGHEPRAETWAWLPLAVAAIYIFLAFPIHRRRATLTNGDQTFATFIIGILLALSFAPPMVFEDASLTAAWSILLPLTAWLSRQLRLPALRHLLLYFTVGICIRLLLNSNILHYSTGPSLFWNPLIWAYLPAFAAILLSLLFLEPRTETPTEPTLLSSLHEVLQFAAALVALAFITLFIHRFFHPDTLADLSAQLLERSTYTPLWLLAAFTLFALGLRLKKPALLTLGYIVGTLALVFLLITELFAFNPLWTPDDFGPTLLINTLLYTFGLPSLFAAALTIWLYRNRHRDPGARPFSQFTGLVSIVLLFVLVTLEVRHAFQGRLLNNPLRPASPEMYAYSAAWALLGTLLVIAGIATRSVILRWASLAVMLLTILKVFLLDTANLSDLYRVFSFAGLGLSLILLGFLYHYFIFKRPAPANATSPPTPEPTP